MAKRNANKPSKPKNLTLSALQNNINKKYKETFTEDFDGYKIDFHKHYSISKINELISEVIDNFRKHQNDGFTTDFLGTYIYIQILRHFTSLAIPKDFDKQLQWVDQLVDAGYLKRIIELIPEKEVEKIMDEVVKQTQQINENMDKFEEEVSEMDLEPEVQDIVDGKYDDVIFENEDKSEDESDESE